MKIPFDQLLWERPADARRSPGPAPYRPGLIAKAVRIGIIAALAWLVVIAIMISD